MKILIVTSEIGFDGGGLSLSCAKLKLILSINNTVEVVNSRQLELTIVKGGYNESVTIGLENESKLKMDSFKYSDFDVVVGFGGGFNGYYASLLAESINASFILSLRGSDINLSKWSIEDNWYLTNACRRSKYIVCLSNEMKKNILSLGDVKSSKIHIIPNFLETPLSSVKINANTCEIIMGCASSFLNEKKGVANLLYMVAELKEISSNKVTFEFVGNVDPDLKKVYKNLIEKLGIGDCVSFVGKMTRDELALQMKKWDYYVQGSICEGHPNAVIEALSMGVAIVTTPTGYIAELAQEVFPEIVFNCLDPKTMADTVNKLFYIESKGEKYKMLCDKLVENCNKAKVKDLWNKLIIPPQSLFTDIPVNNVIAVTLHDISGHTHDNITTPISVFAEFVEYVYRKGMGLCSMREFIAKDHVDQKKYIVCTFDDGYEGLHEHALPILEKYNYSATVFVCTSLFGKDNSWNYKDTKSRVHLNSEQIMELSDAGWEIASHGVSHHNLLKLNDLEVVHQLEESQKALIDLVGYSDSYAYPYGSSNAYIQNIVGKYYKYAFSLTEGGCILGVDNLHIRRYFISDIYRMFGE